MARYRLMVRLLASEEAAIKDLAAANGTSRSEQVRSLVLRGLAASPEPAAPAIDTELQVKQFAISARTFAVLKALAVGQGIDTETIVRDTNARLEAALTQEQKQ